MCNKASCQPGMVVQFELRCKDKVDMLKWFAKLGGISSYDIDMVIESNKKEFEEKNLYFRSWIASTTKNYFVPTDKEFSFQEDKKEKELEHHCSDMVVVDLSACCSNNSEGVKKIFLKYNPHMKEEDLGTSKGITYRYYAHPNFTAQVNE